MGSAPLSRSTSTFWTHESDVHSGEGGEHVPSNHYAVSITQPVQDRDIRGTGPGRTSACKKRQAMQRLPFPKSTHGDELRELGCPRLGFTAFVQVDHLATHAG